MSVKIYRIQAAVIIEGLYPDKEIINSGSFDWSIINDVYFVRDRIQNQKHRLGNATDILDENNVPFASSSLFEAFLNDCINISISSFSQNPTDRLNVNLAKNALGFDAWGRSKSVQDVSILHGIFTNSVPPTMWKESLNGIERTTITTCISDDGALKVQNTGVLNDDIVLDTFRNPRYEPNRGHLYSSAGWIVNKTSLEIRDFGIFTQYAGVFFRVKSDGNLYAVVRNTIVGVTTDDEKLINTSVFGIDIENGNVYDIQFQWRGVGNYKFFINLVEVQSFLYLGTRTKLTMYNPALPIAFRSKNLGGNAGIFFGCVDVTSEGGSQNGKTYGSISIDNQVGQIAITGFNVPIIALRSKKNVDGLRNTRDTLALLLSAYADQRAFMRVWITRDFTAITENNQVWRNFGDGHLEYITYDVPDITTPMSFNTAKAKTVFGCRVDAENTYSTSALFEGRTNIWISPGDMFVFTIHRETGLSANVGATFEFAEEI